MMTFESNQKIISQMTERYRLNENICKDILLRSCLFLIGIGTMICVNHMEFTNEQAADMMKRTVIIADISEFHQEAAQNRRLPL